MNSKKNTCKPHQREVCRFPPTGAKLIAESLRKRAETLPETEKPSLSKFAETCEPPGFQQSIDIQKETLEFLKEQLAIKDEQLADNKATIFLLESILKFV